MGITFVLFWLIRTSKAYLFWIYLWQLKEYQAKRVLDHFRTEKGRKLILDKLMFLKLAILSGLLVFPNETAEAVLVLMIVMLYFIESVKGLGDLFQSRLKIPVFTKKALFLSLASFIFLLFLTYLPMKGELAFSNQCAFSFRVNVFYWLISLDILSPLLASLIVLAFQPIFVLMRNRTIEKAARKRAEFKDLVVIGITGSYGKTSTKEILHSILSSSLRILKTKEHQNSEIAIANTILNDLSKEHQAFIAEMGSYGKGGIKKLGEMAKPSLGIVAGVNEQHLALFGSMENLLSAEGGLELSQSLAEGGTMILNGNNPLIVSKFKNEPVKKIFVSTKEKLDLWAENIKPYKDSLSFDILTKGGEKESFSVSLAGAHNAENVLLAAACALKLGMTLKEIAEASKRITMEQGGIKVFQADGINIIDSSYSANPDGALADLDYLSLYSGKKVIVMPCLIELGKASSKIHRRIGERIGKVCSLAIINTKDKFKELKEGAVSSGMSQENIIYIPSPDKAIAKLSQYLDAGDAVLFEGRSDKRIIEALK